MGFAEHLAEDRRLVILRLLAEQAQYALNASTLRSALDCVGHAVSREQIEADLDWLAGRKLVVLERLPQEARTAGGQGAERKRHDREYIIVATATARGVDTAEGRERIDGVRRPGPEG